MIIKKIISLSIMIVLSLGFVAAQDKDKEKDKENDKEKGTESFKENLFTGGSVSLAFYNNTFLIGGSPVFGYSVTNWVDAGLVFNYNYTSYRDVSELNDHLHQSVYGGGMFLKLYPVRFLFAQVQAEHNFIRQKYLPAPGSPLVKEVVKGEADSYLVGGGYTTGRYGRGGEPFFYLSVLFDLSKNVNSPYTDAYGRTIPIIRGGIQIPLFQGSNSNSNSNDKERRRRY